MVCCVERRALAWLGSALIELDSSLSSPSQPAAASTRSSETPFCPAHTKEPLAQRIDMDKDAMNLLSLSLQLIVNAGGINVCACASQGLLSVYTHLKA